MVIFKGLGVPYDTKLSLKDVPIHQSIMEVGSTPGIAEIMLTEELLKK